MFAGNSPPTQLPQQAGRVSVWDETARAAATFCFVSFKTMGRALRHDFAERRKLGQDASWVHFRNDMDLEVGGHGNLRFRQCCPLRARRNRSLMRKAFRLPNEG